ncbi:MAG: hypothetical protein GX321_05345 [Clostridiales bacterium]|nr:hypothetical protein [Clostridiales bacterium]
MSKNTRLEDDASIYQPRKESSENIKLKNMPFKKKLSYLWDYYKIQGLVIIAILAFAIYVIYEIRTPNAEIKLYTALINNTIHTEVWEEYEETMMDLLELDPATSQVYFNDIFYYNGTTDYAMNVRATFNLFIASADIDLVIAPQSEFINYVNLGILDKLSEQLPTDLYSSLTDKFYLSSTEENPKVQAYGIYLTDTKLFKDHSIPTEGDPYIIGIAFNSRHKENATKFIRYIFKEE